MSIVYSRISDRELDVDAMEVIELLDGDYVARDDEASIFLAYERGLIHDDQMEEMGYEN